MTDTPIAATDPAPRATTATTTAAKAATKAATTAAGPMVPASTYQLLRDRLQAVAGRLKAAADEVNVTRATLFASVPLALVEQDRLRTEQPSQPRDVVSVGDLLLFGFNISGALGRVRTVRDAFALYRVPLVVSFEPADTLFESVRAVL